MEGIAGTTDWPQNGFVLEDRTTKFLARWLPVAVLADLCFALAAHAWAWPSMLVYGALGITVVATIMAGIAYLGSLRGIQSVEDAGFQNYNAWLNYTLGWRGLRASGIVLLFATLLVAIYTGLGRTSSGLLAFFTFPLAGLYQAVTRRYPADDRTPRD